MKLILEVAILAQFLSAAAQICTPSAVALVKQQQTKPKVFCNNYLATQKSNSPIKGLDANAASKACFCILSPSTKTVTITAPTGACGNTTSTKPATPTTTGSSRSVTGSTSKSTSTRSTSSAPVGPTTIPVNCTANPQIYYIQLRLPSPTGPFDPIESFGSAINGSYLLGPTNKTASRSQFANYLTKDQSVRRFTYSSASASFIEANSTNWLTASWTLDGTTDEFGRANANTTDLGYGRISVTNWGGANDTANYLACSNWRNESQGLACGGEVAKKQISTPLILTYLPNFGGWVASLNTTVAWENSKRFGLQGTTFHVVKGC
ncbi:hypothetical protein B9Z65_7117 [Elsinoe australis]|uniref:Uncharacterized protein n=1 Tax=Elsinoe australis TaxID=40998 RepID=A0A2P7Z5X8_9PEZI|nr:hypothetical protein B9Z65_7117 [Elsinoe australis]